MKHRHPLVCKISRALALLERMPRSIIVGVSGGPDSTALLRALIELGLNHGSRQLVVAHVNHQLRGAESDAEEEFVRHLCESLQSDGKPNLEFRTTRVTIQPTGGADRNLHGNARRIRYAWLLEIARAENAGLVVTGHTADDQAETVLHHLIRGTGPKGLRGIASRRPLSEGLELLRPMLKVTRGEVLSYLVQLGQSFREDSSNRNWRRTRSRIRHELLPLLSQKYNPKIRQILCRTAATCGCYYRDLVSPALACLEAGELERAGNILVFDRRAFAREPRGLIREAMRLVWQRERWSQGRMSYHHWDMIADIIQGQATALDLPGGISARARGHIVQIGCLT